MAFSRRLVFAFTLSALRVKGHAFVRISMALMKHVPPLARPE
jgi:hypothetical protein